MKINIFSIMISIFLFMGCKKEPDLAKPVVETKDIIEVQFDYVTVSGGISSVGEVKIKDYGFAIATHPSPTLDDDIIALGITDSIVTFQETFLNLKPETDYYVCSYAQYGNNVQYGNTISFKTLKKPWIEKAAFAGGNLIRSASFVIDAVLYVGTGWSSGGFSNSFYKYNPLNDTWWGIANLPSSERSGAISFSIGGYGYVGLGEKVIGSNVSYLNDLWKYNPNINVWERMADFPVSVSPIATCFVISDKAYVVGGSFYGKQDLWVYNTLDNTWTKKADYPGGCFGRGLSFSLNNKGYVGLGWSGKTCNDLWEYDPIKNLWNEKTSFPGTPRFNVGCFVFNGKGYLLCGENLNTYIKDIWSYNPIDDTWIKVQTYYPGKGRTGMFVQAINKKVILGLGTDGNSSQDWYNDIWEFTPDF